MSARTGSKTTTPARVRKKKDGYHHGDLRAALLKEAIAWVAREGTAAVSLRELAQRVGVTHAAPYRHFRDKDSLFAAVAEEGFRLLRAAMIERRDAAGTDPVERLLATGVAYTRFAVDHPGHFKVMFSHVGKPPPDVPEVAEEGANAFGVLLDCIVQAQRAGRIRPGDPRRPALLCWAGVHGLSSLLIEECLTPLALEGDVESLATQLVEDLMNGAAVR